MPVYRVYALYAASKCLGEVEAENAEEAIDKLSEETYVSLCWQCAGEVNLGDCYEFETEIVNEEEGK